MTDLAQAHGLFDASTERRQLKPVHEDSHVDDFKVADIFAKVEFIRYVSNMCTGRLQPDFELY